MSVGIVDISSGSLTYELSQQLRVARGWCSIGTTQLLSLPMCVVTKSRPRWVLKVQLRQPATGSEIGYAAALPKWVTATTVAHSAIHRCWGFDEKLKQDFKPR